MTTATASHTTNYGTTDTWYRAWGSAFSAALTASGLVQTADTGQVDWSSVTIPAVNTTTTAPYEVWRFDDALQGSAPIFIKIHYARNNAGAIRVLFFTGTGSNGSGTLTGAVQGFRYLLGDNSNSAQAAPASTTYVAYGTGYLTIVSGLGNTCYGGFVVERTANSSGVYTADGHYITCGSHSVGSLESVSALTTYSPSPAIAYGFVSSRGSMAPTGFTTSVIDSDIMLLPRWYMLGTNVAVSYDTAVCSTGAVVSGTVFTTELAAGVGTRSYMATGVMGATFTGVSMVICARYE